MNSLKKQGIKTGLNVISELGTKPFGEIMTEQGKAAIDELALQGIKKLQQIQDGDGIAKTSKPNIKIGLKFSKNQSLLYSKKRRIVNRKSKKNKFEDIFN